MRTRRDGGEHQSPFINSIATTSHPTFLSPCACIADVATNASENSANICKNGVMREIEGFTKQKV